MCALLATCARWVTHSTCALPPSSRNSVPTVSPVVPPMPASTSSKISVGVVCVAAVTTWMARLMRDSSPPEAILCKAPAGLPGMVAIKNFND